MACKIEEAISRFSNLRGKTKDVEIQKQIDLISKLLEDKRKEGKNDEIHNQEINHDIKEGIPKYKMFDANTVPVFDPTAALSRSIEAMNVQVRDRMEVAGASLFALAGVGYENANKELDAKFPIYARSREWIHDIWRGNSSISEIRRYMDVSAKNYNKDRYHNIKSQTHKLEQDMIAEDNKIALEVERSILVDYGVKKDTKEANELMSHLNNVVAKSGIFALGLDKTANKKSTIERLVNGEDIKGLIAENTKILTSREIEATKDLAQLYINGKRGTKHINPGQIANRGKGNVKYEAVSRLAALYSLELIDGSVDTLRDGFNKAGFTSLYEAAVSNAAIAERTYERYPELASKVKGNFIMDIESDGSKELKIITKEERSAGIVDKKQGWVIITEPSYNKTTKERTRGIMARPSTGTMQQGMAGINVNLATSDKVISNNSPDADKDLPWIGDKDGKTLRLLAFTNEEKQKLGYADSAVQSLIRTRSHNRFILETQGLRKMLSDTIYKVGNKDSIQELYDIVFSKDLENPWMLDTKDIKIEDAETQKKFDSILKEYDALKSTKRDQIIITDLDGMSKNASFIRNDMSAGVTGFRSSLFTNYKANRAHDIFKKFIVQQKIYQIVLNMPKIFVDTLSGFTYITTIGVPMLTAAKGYRDIPNELRRFAELRNTELRLKNKLEGTVETTAKATVKAELTIASKAVNDHRFAGPMYKGLLQSMSTDITMKNFDSVSGLDADETRILSKLFRRDDGDLNVVGDWIMKAAKSGPEFQNGLKAIGEAGNGTNAVQRVLREAAENIQDHKDSGNVEAYLKEFLGAPSSEATKLGSALTHWSDVIPRIIGFEYNMEKLTREFKSKNGRDPNAKEADRIEEDAAAEVRQGLGDFLDNAPQLVHELSSVFVLMYPSFWARMQKVLWNLGVKHPVSMLMVFASSMLLGTGGLHIFGSNILEKATNGSIINNPFTGSTSLPFGNLMG